MAGRDHRIVVGVDGSESSIESLRWAVAQARMTGATLDVVTGWEVSAFAYPVIGADDPVGYDPLLTARAVAEAAVSAAFEGDPDVPITISVVEGHPAPVLVESAAEADLLVVGSSGHGAFIGMLLGSVTAYCTQHAPCPVVVVRA